MRNAMLIDHEKVVRNNAERLQLTEKRWMRLANMRANMNLRIQVLLDCIEQLKE